METKEVSIIEKEHEKQKCIICIFYTDSYGTNRCERVFNDFDSLYKHIKESNHDIFTIR